MKKTMLLTLFLLAAAGCEEVDHSGEKPLTDIEIALEDVAGILAAIPVDSGHLLEVHDAVCSSSANGYDEEYTMRDLFSEPGSGVGDAQTRALGGNVAPRSYVRPLRDLITDYVSALPKTRAGISAEEYLAALRESDIQIYWPYCESWDEEEYPIITFDPMDESSTNLGYLLKVGEDGSRSVEEIVVDESLAKTHPVWVVNRNSDASFTSLEMLRRQDPDYGGGGRIVVGGQSGSTKASGGSIRTLLLKSLKAKRNYDPWFAGASEFFVKIGAVEDFTASTEAELQLYDPNITDFMIVVKRSEIGKEKPFDVVLVSKWTDQLESCAFMVTEDDGGTMTSWKCSSTVKIKSKSYGFDIDIPVKTRDDIVWRGQLAASYFERYSDSVGHFGDIDLVFELVEH